MKNKITIFVVKVNIAAQLDGAVSGAGSVHGNGDRLVKVHIVYLKGFAGFQLIIVLNLGGIGRGLLGLSGAAGAAGQGGIFISMIIASLMGFPLNDAASIGIIGAADGPTAILVSQRLNSNFIAAILVVAYCYMALVPMIQPVVLKATTTKKERAIQMHYSAASVSKTTRIIFPIVATIVCGILAPDSAALVGMLMFGNLIRECGVLDSLSRAAQDMLSPLITLVLGLAISPMMSAESLLTPATLMIMGFGLVAFIFDTACGVLFLKIVNIFLPREKKINPLIGGAGISAFPMSSRVVQKVGIEANKQNHLLPFALGANVSGQIASVLAGGLLLSELLPIFG